MKNIFKYILFLSPVIIFLVITVWIYLMENKDIDYVLEHDYILNINNQKILLKSVNTPQEHSVGLGNIDNISKKEGMLFIFDEDTRYPFWMKDMRFDIDILFVDSDKRVVHIVYGASVCEDECNIYISPYMYRYVIEMKKGRVLDLGIKINDSLDIKQL